MSFMERPKAIRSQLTEEQIEIFRKRCHDVRERYEQEHKYCPKCHGNDYRTTLVGYISDGNYDHYRDKNTVRCSCGWVGVFHDLVEAPVA